MSSLKETVEVYNCIDAPQDSLEVSAHSLSALVIAKDGDSGNSVYVGLSRDGMAKLRDQLTEALGNG